MPLLRRQQFVKESLPEGLDPDEELFYCKLTNEVFRDYDAFFERIILCNSLVWTCEMTGKPGLTYAEALDSEESARACLKAMPDLIKRIILYFGCLSKRTRLGELCDDVFSYMKGRFFVGEEVDVVVDGNRKLCVVVKVIVPRPNRRKSVTSELAVDNCKDDGHDPVEENAPDIDTTMYKYKVKQIGDPNENLLYVSPPDITRKKRVYSREKNKLFLKHTCEQINNVWIVKPKLLEKYRVSELRFKEFFGGAKPNFDAISNWKKQHLNPVSSTTTPITNSKLKSKTVEKKPKKQTDTPPPPPKKRKVSENVEKDSSKAAKDAERIRMNKEAALALKKAKRAMEERRKAKEEIKKKMLEQRIKMKEEKEKEREKIREEKRILAECLREWQKPRDDLECDDLTELPHFVPVDCGIPNEHFGDAVMILEFINNFADQLLIKDIFPQGLSFDALEKAVVENDIQGSLNDLLQLLLKVIFRFQEEEEEDQENLDRAEKQGNNSEDHLVKDDENSRVASSLVSSQGTILRKLTLDAFTLTEVLRLHLLSSGSRPNVMDSFSRDEPGLQLQKDDPELLRNLAVKSVFELSPAEKLKILQVLVNQLLSHMAIHDEIEERLEKLKVAKLDLRQWQWAEQRREKEEASARVRKRAEDRKAAESETPNRVDDERKQKELEEDEERAAEIEMKHKQDYLKKERELSESVFRLQHRGTLLPLGRDRAYRRYWMFSALPGLYIEDDETEVGYCLPEPTPIDPNVNANMSFNLSVNLARHQALKSFNSVSGKENEASKAKNITLNGQAGSLIKSHKLLSDNHPTINGAVKPSPMGDEEMSVTVEKPISFGICTADGDMCPTHGSRRKSSALKWSFVSTAAQLESLISSLNPRGFREGGLKEILVAEKKRVLQSVAKCPSNKLNPAALKLSESAQNEVRKSSRLQPGTNTALTGDSSVNDFIELTLSDSILELEEKIYAGGLGSIKCGDRIAWRDAIINQVFNKNKSNAVEVKEETTVKPIVNGHLERDSGCESEVEKSESESNSCSEPVCSVVQKLSTSLLHIFQGIEPKYLISPLGTDRDVESGSKFHPYNLAARWEESLLLSTNFSQIFLHLTTLERSVAWSRSVLNARCRICRRKGDAEHMLLCDGCDRGHHMYCLKPALEEIPEGDWLCPDCCPKEGKTKSRKKRSTVKEEEDEEVNQELVSGDGLDLIEEAVDQESEGKYQLSVTEAEEIEDDDGSEMCCVCEKGGEVISCEICFLAFHLKCLKPPPRRFPRGRWCCPKCSELTQELRHSASSSRSKKSIDKVEKPRKKMANDTKGLKNTADAGAKRNSVSNEKEDEILDSTSPRRSGRNMGRKINYRKHSLHESDDEYVTQSPTKRLKRSVGRQTSELSDDEYYGLTKRHSPPSRRGASEDVPLDYKTCDQLLTELVRHDDGWPFLRPVGKKEVPSYHDIIKRPMDFGTMRSRLNDMWYQNNKEFVADMFLIFQNCCIFNPADSIQYEAAERLGRFFQRRVKEVRLNLAMMDIIRVVPTKTRNINLIDTLSKAEDCLSSEDYASEKESLSDKERCESPESDVCSTAGENSCTLANEDGCESPEIEPCALTDENSHTLTEKDSSDLADKMSSTLTKKDCRVAIDEGISAKNEQEPEKLLTNGEVMK